MSIEFNISLVCPALKNMRAEKYAMTFYPNIYNHGDIAPCPWGGKTPEGEIVSDAYIAKRSIAVEIKCKGCSLCPKGFNKKLRKRI